MKNKAFSCVVILIMSLSCNKNAIEPFTIDVNIKNPVNGEVIVFIEDSLKNDRTKWEVQNINSNGKFHFSDTINEPRFYYFQLGKTPVYNDLIVFPGDNIKINISDEEMDIESNKSQIHLTKTFHQFKMADVEEKKEIFKSKLRGSPIILKALEVWPYYLELDDEITEIIEDFISTHPDWNITSLIKKEYFSLKRTSIGSLAPNLILPNSTGDSISLKDYRGKFILLDFWGTWCKPCIKEVPNTKLLYKNLKNKHFEIIGIAVQTDKVKWENFISNNEMTWTQVIDQGKSSNNLFKLNSFPSTFLIDPKGRIIAKNLRPHNNWEQTINEILTNN
ncbi:redoxin domain-containing protein [uncultured Psychroserpens sp.]|uniref:redoxin domain-containing protein n=1 Tax=uncultured Psychroserpens sp. TaxID=255436 RepID=UPI0026378B11|nr:redoxin domain-containing protein [uncultured Psychroserpens sp.]